MLIDGSFVWKLHATYGVPVEISFDLLAEKGLIPIWDQLFAAAKKDGANLERLKERVLIAVRDSYDRETASEIEKRMRLWWNGIHARLRT